MKIVIVGDGKVGFTLAKQLEHEGHDVTIIENKEQVLSNTMNMLDVVGIQGNGASYDVQLEAQVPQADILIAATSTDEMNIICCLIAKKLGARHTIARIRNPEYAKSLVVMKEELGLSMHINPEQAASREILRALRFSSSIRVSSFAKSKIEMVEIKLRHDNPFIQKQLKYMHREFRSKILVCAIQRGDEVIIPTGETILMENDKISITGTDKHLDRLFRQFGILNRKVKDVMIVGGGRITYYLTRALLELGIHVKIIEMNKERCIHLVETFPEATIIHGDGTDHELLLSESLEEQDAFVALTDNDEENVIISMFASSHGVEKILPKVNRVSLGFLLEKLGIENAITPKNITANQIIQYVRAMQNSVGSNVESLIKIIDDKVEVLEFRVHQSCTFVNIPLEKLSLKKGIIINYITHKGLPKIANGKSKIQVGDTLIIISQLHGLRELNDVLA